MKLLQFLFTCAVKMTFKCIIMCQCTSDKRCKNVSLQPFMVHFVRGLIWSNPTAEDIPKMQHWKSAYNKIIWRSSAPTLLLSFSFMYSTYTRKVKHGTKLTYTEHVWAEASGTKTRFISYWSQKSADLAGWRLTQLHKPVTCETMWLLFKKPLFSLLNTPR